LVAQLAAAQKALSEEKSARSATTKALVEEQASRQTAEQALKSSDESKAKLAQALETTKVVYIITRDKLSSKSKELDDMVT
jgi:hypothetical protein